MCGGIIGEHILLETPPGVELTHPRVGLCAASRPATITLEELPAQQSEVLPPPCVFLSTSSSLMQIQTQWSQ